MVKNTVTVDMLNKSTEMLAKVFREELGTTNTRVGNLEKTINQLQHKAQEAERRGRGTTRANGEIAAIQRELANMKAKLDRINSETGGGVKHDPVVLAAFQDEAKRIDERASELFTRANKTLQELEGRVSTLEGESARHGMSIMMLEEGQSSLDGRVQWFENERDTIPWGRIGISAAIGVIAGIWSYFFILGSYTLPDGVVVNQLHVLLFAILTGIGSFGVAVGILHIFRKRNQQNTHRLNGATYVAPPVPINPNPVQSSATAAETAPTKVMETQGANSGTR